MVYLELTDPRLEMITFFGLVRSNVCLAKYTRKGSCDKYKVWRLIVLIAMFAMSEKAEIFASLLISL